MNISRDDVHVNQDSWKDTAPKPPERLWQEAWSLESQTHDWRDTKPCATALPNLQLIHSCGQKAESYANLAAERDKAQSVDRMQESHMKTDTVPVKPESKKLEPDYGREPTEKELKRAETQASDFGKLYKSWIAEGKKDPNSFFNSFNTRLKLDVQHIMSTGGVKAAEGFLNKFDESTADGTGLLKTLRNSKVQEAFGHAGGVAFRLAHVVDGKAEPLAQLVNLTRFPGQESEAKSIKNLSDRIDAIKPGSAERQGERDRCWRQINAILRRQVEISKNPQEAVDRLQSLGTLYTSSFSDEVRMIHKAPLHDLQVADKTADVEILTGIFRSSSRMKFKVKLN